MPFLIDGDNLLHAARGIVPEAERANRAWLCGLLAEWDRGRRYDIVVYFDGFRPDDPGDGPVAEGHLVIRYSERVTADDRIIEAIEASSAPRRLIVVSTDRQIRMVARRRRAAAPDSATFIAQVLSDVERSDRKAPSEPPEKFEGLSPEQTDAWLREFGYDPTPDEDDHDPYGLLD